MPINPLVPTANCIQCPIEGFAFSEYHLQASGSAADVVSHSISLLPADSGWYSMIETVDPMVISNIHTFLFCVEPRYDMVFVGCLVCI